jgi:hypothetical protein
MPVLQREEYRARARMLASYLVTGAGHGYDGVRSEGELEEHLQRFDEIALPGELARLHDRIDAACAEDFEWGQFEVWWENPAREHRLSSAQYVLGRMYSHDDLFLRALLRQAQLQRSEEPLHADGVESEAPSEAPSEAQSDDSNRTIAYDGKACDTPPPAKCW